MIDFLIVVNGVPGAGKTTLAGSLARELAVPLIAKDAIKEALSDAMNGSLPTSQLGAVAAENVWAIARMLSGTVIVESFWAAGRDDSHFRRGFEALAAPRGVEIWCHTSHDVARERFLTRDRHAAHSDAGRLPEWELLSSSAAPITGLPVMSVETTTAVDVPLLAATLREHIAPGALR
ncbi:putative kinase [Agromyces hippuratus]|uniref:Putative kinase n=1 Tax=Agromyces hippuratus TaxID=286438 RepID=A0A852WVA4_9MICO|nr:AAA family ATPase [Agromyces hippuratus]NYG19903.1 putative kinase [Agromyces hippuratus]